MYWIFIIPIIVLIFRFKNSRIIDWFRPSVIMITYMTTNLFFGVIILEKDLLFYDRYNDIVGHSNYNESLIILFSALFLSAAMVPVRPLYLQYQKLSSFLLLIVVSVLICVLLMPINLPLLGLQGSVSIYIILALLPIVLLSIKSLKFYIFFSLAVLVMASQVFFDNKREVIFLALLSFGLFGLRFFNFRLRHIVVFVGIGIFTVLYLSLLRGYGGYNLSNFDKIFVVFEYVKDPSNFGYIVTNFELESAACNAIKNVERVLDGSLEPTYGEGFLKPVTMPIPRWIWPDKPINYVTYYTSNVYPNLWREGLSLPVLLVSEFFGSFKWLSLLFFPVFTFWMDRIYLALVASKNLVLVAIGLVLCSTSVQYARGSGLEMYLYPIVFGAPFYIMLWKR